ncbi:hypothetical protein EI94DRAFT_1742461 [Lactarius quietus]|nr:hypothetical protein EI94DRAFT_1742461 [Lactarius quietus]
MNSTAFTILRVSIVLHIGLATGTSLPHHAALTALAVTLIDDHRYPPQASQGESDYVDSSGPIFSMYLGTAEEENRKTAHD